MHTHQRTLASTVSCSGVGVHSGKTVNLNIRPAPVNHGIKFVRTDLLDSPGISALFKMVVDTSLATVIGYDGFIVSTIEHLMAAFSGLAIDNALVEIDTYEMPIMDGSARPFIDLMRTAGIVAQDMPRCYFRVQEPIELSEQGKFVGIYPADNYRITGTIEFSHPLIGHQSCSFDISEDLFAEQIGPARTFGFLEEYELLKQYGLARGGSLDNVIVIGEGRVMNPGGLRFPDEFVRHKILDCIGDFSLIGMPIIGHVVVEKSGHAFNHAFLEKFFEEKDAWQTCTLS